MIPDERRTIAIFGCGPPFSVVDSWQVRDRLNLLASCPLRTAQEQRDSCHCRALSDRNQHTVFEKRFN